LVGESGEEVVEMIVLAVVLVVEVILRGPFW
jgi:hypothetical protein